MPGEVHVTPASSLETSSGQTEGMIRQNAIVDLSDKLCSSVMTAKPHSSSAVHHHGEQDTIIYAFRGHGTIVSSAGRTRQHLHPGDFALIPAFVEHQEVNESDEDVVWIITRSGRTPVVENLGGWSES
ncbi:hypothetical protein LTR66_015502 [Elasticomyces elasticus]|nr:hypothetical protein LTR66_015502 [Elasticomyces elasticus]KAK4939168.1 hypothetical protein LTR28_009426 [Elasticomyces elasticus]KAK4990142.1 hypothetical protein LTR50_002772 [Elasticomyces elasticus]